MEQVEVGMKIEEEQNPAAQLDALLRANFFKDKLLAVIGHDLKSPLHTIQSTLALVQDESLSAAEKNYLLKMLPGCVDSALHMLDNLLDWAAQNYYCDVRHAKAKKEPLNIHTIVDTAISSVRHLALKKGIGLINNVWTSLTVHADLQQILFVLRNAISNAIKFSYPNDRIFISAGRQGTKAEISVIDFGMGMSAERIQSLFNMDKRVSREGTQKEKGAGLGLILCKEFVENNGGDIRIESKEGEGTRLIISLDCPVTSGRRIPSPTA